MAIAFDNFTDLGSTTSASFTVTGTNGILLVGYEASSAGTVTSATFNGVAMTRVGTEQTVPGVGGDFCGMFYIVGFSAGTFTISVPNALILKALSYTGASQTGQPDSSNTGTVTSTSHTLSTTVVASNCWLVAWQLNNNVVTSAGTSTTVRGAESSGRHFYDSNGIVGTGSQSLQWTWSGSFGDAGIIASIAPFSAAAVSSPTITLLRA